MMKETIKKFIPEFILLFYHYCLAQMAGLFYQWPSKKLIVIGITGTSGKSTQVFLLAKILNEAGFKIGYTSTQSIKIGEQEFVNQAKMTMLGRFALQRYLKKMVIARCQYAIIEVTSEGIRQYRHQGINFDGAVFTNLSPEHIEVHGLYENYRETKLKLFEKLSKDRIKVINGQKIEKICVVNLDDKEAGYFSQYKAAKNYGCTIKNSSPVFEGQKVIKAENIRTDFSGTRFKVLGLEIESRLMGEFNAANILSAITTSLALGIDLSVCQKALAKIQGMPGRMEVVVDEPFKVIVDFAFLPQAFEKIYQVLEKIPHKNIIHVFGGTGGGRDKWRRPLLGKFAAIHADYIFITNEDPYDEDPNQIINDVAQGVYETKQKTEGKNFWKILDRKEAIEKALTLAKPEDIVLITGKGAEPVMAIAGGKKIPWDDRKIIMDFLNK